VFGNRELRRIFGPKREEVAGDWRRLHNEELHNLYSSPDDIRVIKSRSTRCAGRVGRGRDECIQNFGGKPEGKRQLRRPTHRWEIF
jgi:hypothetical protein